MRRDRGQGPEDEKTTRDLEERKRHNFRDQAEENQKETERIEEMKKKQQQS